MNDIAEKLVLHRKNKFFYFICSLFLLLPPNCIWMVKFFRHKYFYGQTNVAKFTVNTGHIRKQFIGFYFTQGNTNTICPDKAGREGHKNHFRAWATVVKDTLWRLLNKTYKNLSFICWLYSPNIDFYKSCDHYQKCIHLATGKVPFSMLYPSWKLKQAAYDLDALKEKYELKKVPLSFWVDSKPI